METEDDVLDGIAKHMLGFAEAEMRERGKLTMMVHAIARTGSAMLIVPFVPTETEQARLLRDAFIAWDVTCYGMVSEAWIMPWRPDSEIRPSQSEVRREALIAIACDGLNRRVCAGEIIRDETGFVGTRPFHMPVTDIKGALTQLLPVPEVSRSERRALKSLIQRLKTDVLAVQPFPKLGGRATRH